MLRAADIMTNDVATIRSSATVSEAVKLMRARDWRALIVERRHPQDAYGIITNSDIISKVIAYGKNPSKGNAHLLLAPTLFYNTQQIILLFLVLLQRNHSLYKS